MKTIREAYFGIDFPQCFYRFQEFVEKLRTEHRIDINRCALQIQLGDVFQALGPEFDARSYNPALTSRYPNDPPEFFTLVHGPSGGQHWGYYLEDPAEPEFYVASYFHSEPLHFSIDGLNLFEAVRKHLERVYEDNLEYTDMYAGDEGDEGDEYKEQLEELDTIRSLLKSYYTGEREETGEAYVETYRYQREVTAPTRDGIGIRLAGELYRPVPGSERFLNPRFSPGQAEVEHFMEEARQLLELGFPGAELKLGKDLWCYPQYREEAFEVLASAYEALGRTILLRSLQLARQQQLVADRVVPL